MSAPPRRDRVCAVVVAYRSAAHLPALLPDLLAACEQVVVVDQACPDGSGDVAERLGATVVRAEANRGFAAGVNLGAAAAMAQATVLLLVNPDCRVPAEAVRALRAAAQRHPGHVRGPVVHDQHGALQPTRASLPSAWAFLGEELVVRESARPGSFPARLWARWQSYDAEVEAPLLSGVCLWVPRVTWDATGPMDESFFMYREEMDWQLRARRLGHATVLVPSARITHERAASSGRHDPRRARWLGASTRRFVLRWLPGWRGRVSLGLLALGQAVRLAAWSLPNLRRRPAAAQRRAQHAATLTALLGRRP